MGENIIDLSEQNSQITFSDCFKNADTLAMQIFKSL